MTWFKKLFAKEQKKIIIKQEIDYDKLAQAIIDAQKRLKEEEDKANENELIVTKGLFATIPFIFLVLLAIISCGFIVVGFGMAICDFDGFTAKFWSYIGIAIIAIVLTFISGGTAYEIYKLKDFNKIIAISSSFTSIIAAIISLVTLIISLKVS